MSVGEFLKPLCMTFDILLGLHSFVSFFLPPASCLLYHASWIRSFGGGLEPRYIFGAEPLDQ